MRYFLGLDLGQSAEYSALAILERQGPSEAGAIFHCRHLQRWPLRTPYPEIVADVAGKVRSRELQRGEDVPLLAVDATSVGAPIVDMFRRGLNCRTGGEVYVFRRGVGLVGGPGLRADVDLRAVQLTGAGSVTQDGTLYRVPKLDLVGAAQAAMQTGRLKVAEGLEHAETLRRELASFQVKVTLSAAQDSYEAWREGAQDDLVLAVCVGLWAAEHVNAVFEEAGHSEGFVEYRF